MKHLKNVLVIVAFLSTSIIFAQTKLTGKVVDENNQPLPGASVVVKGTSTGTSTDFDGNFTLSAPSNSGDVVVSYMGYYNKTVAFSGTKNLGTIKLEPSAESLDEVVITGVADIAKDRKTPVAVSTIRAEQIVETIGTKELPEVLNATPSVYATKQGGGFGDSRINIRGFDQRNTAVMINGMPVNDMENGWVYWSNWAGLTDVTSAMQVQRGLGSSKLAISSVGGTINVLTRAADKAKGGSVSATVGNDNYLKTLISYNTGRLDNGLAVSALFARTAGDGYVQGTKFEGYSYYLGFGYKPNDKHDFQLTITGAPQYHNKRGYAPSLNDYIKYGGSLEKPNIKYNSDFGYRNGKEDTFGGNFYHKPVASLNWDWKMGEVSKLSTVLYASLGRGGSVGSIGRINGARSYALPKDANGHIRFDDIVKWNKGQEVPDFGGGRYNSPIIRSQFNGSNFNTGNDGFPRSIGGKGKYGSDNGISQRSSINSHNWFGAISNFNTELTENLTLDFGVDLRTYKGLHYRRLVDYMGADGYIDYDDKNHPGGVKITKLYSPAIGNIWNVFKSVDDEQKMDYYNVGKVNWMGAFTQLEYSNDEISAFIQGAVSNQGFKRIDYFNYLNSDPEQESGWENILGGNVKGGVNWNINENHNVFANAGFYSRQPNFDAVFPNYTNNDTNKGLVNEKVVGLEVGYGFRHENYKVNLNLYRTSWKDRFLRIYNTFDVNNTPKNKRDDVRGSANLEGVEQIHKGIELEAFANFGKLDVELMATLGNYEYASNVSAKYFDESEKPIGNEVETLYLKGKKVGDAPQTTVRLGLKYEIAKNLKFRISQFYVQDLYADIEAEAFSGEKGKNMQTLKLPAYSLLDAGLSYKLNLGDTKSLNFAFNVNNLADKVYISESETNVFEGDRGATGVNYKGVDTGNRVFFGWGRTWNASVRFDF